MPKARLFKIGLIIFALAALAIAFRELPVAQWLTAFRTWVAGLGFLGYVLYAVVYAICIVLFIPGSVLTLGAGATFGVIKGTIVVVIGATLGATLAFIVARTIARKRVEAMAAKDKRFRALDRAIASEGAKIVLLVRLAVVFPFTYTNYVFGLTGVRVLPYALATLVGIIPGTIAFVYIGAAAAEATAGTVKLVVYIVGAVLALIASAFVARVAVKAIHRAGIEE
ncbi:MAG TPA: TVP38/TMEM64 family protein [Thermoanaerobaculia bacterium]|nr:TVP38/TMEM64 family protein [Thermoanaerobaculia bacterium]